MRAFLLSLVIPLLIIANISASPDLRNHVVMIETPYCVGSGVVVKQGILTAAHVVSGPQEQPVLGEEDVAVTTFQGDMASGQVICKDDVNDLAVLTMPRKYRLKLRADLAKEDLTVGENCSVVGCGASIPWSLKYGNIANIVNPWLVLDAQVFPGDSGSPVFNNHGQVSGIVVGVNLVNWGGIPGPAYGLAVRLEGIREILKRARL